MFAQIVVDLDALFRQLGVEHLSDQRNAAPQPVPALVSAFSAATVWQPLLIAAIRSPLLTSKQEQICALSGSLSTPMDGLPLPAWAGRISESGFSGSSMALSTSCSRLP